MLTKRMCALATGSFVVLWMAGCRVDTKKDGDHKDVRIATPFGGLQVTTNPDLVLQEIGLSAYPGAVQDDKGKDHSGAADVNMKVGSFNLRVKAVSYRTSDPPDKVKEYYRDQLKRYGDVIECENNVAVGTPTHTFEGLTCDAKEGGHITVQDHPGKHELELKTGSRQHQRIVSIGADGDGTKFGLVVLDLPKKMVEGDDTRQ
jgi:hypothetical protein